MILFIIITTIIYILSIIWCRYELKYAYGIYGCWYGLTPSNVDIIAMFLPLVNSWVAFALFVRRRTGWDPEKFFPSN
jgi:hypothetical protein